MPAGTIRSLTGCQSCSMKITVSSFLKDLVGPAVVGVILAFLYLQHAAIQQLQQRIAAMPAVPVQQASTPVISYADAVERATLEGVVGAHLHRAKRAREVCRGSEEGGVPHRSALAVRPTHHGVGHFLTGDRTAGRTGTGYGSPSTLMITRLRRWPSHSP